MIIKLISLEFANIGRYIEPQTIVFSNRKKLLQIDGKRLDYNGGSGSGKSTIFQVNDFILGINNTPATVLQSRKTKSSMWAIGTYDVETENGTFRLKIERNKKTGLSITGQDPFNEGKSIEISGNNELAEEFIEKVIEIPKDIFKIMTHKRQKDNGFFLKLTPSKSYEFMIKALGLGEWLKKIKKAEDQLKIAESELAISNNNLQALQSSVELFSAAVASAEETLKNMPPEVDASKLPQLAENLKSLQDMKSRISSEMAEEIAKISKPIKGEPQGKTSKEFELEEKLTAAEKELSSLRDGKLKKIGSLNTEISQKKTEILLLNEKIKKESTLKVEIQKMVGDVKLLESGTCMTCGQVWQSDTTKEKIEELKAILNNRVADYKKIASYKAEVEKLTADLEPLVVELQKIQTMSFDEKEQAIALIRSEISEITLERKKNNSEISSKNEKQDLEYRLAVKDVETKYSEKTSEISMSINTISAEITSITSLKDQRDKMVKSAEKNLVDTKKALENAVSSVEASLLDYKTKEEKKLLIEESKQAMKSYTMGIFEDALTEIGIEATERLAGIPNTSASTVYFDSFKEKDGKIKEEITAYVSMEGDEGVPVKSLSGGEESAIDLAIDLAVVEVIERRGGVGADWFVMDEPFGGFDTECKLNCIELLRNTTSSKRIILVDHTAEVKEMFEDRITVIRDNDKSYIEGGVSEA